jgi:lipid-binding SYLF domain-containing protein
LPESLDKECEKAARILKGFCSKSSITKYTPIHLANFLSEDGIYSDVVPPTTPSAAPVPVPTTADTNPPADPSKSKKPSRVLLTIPSKVIARAQGLAIFTSVRVGFQATGSSGSGILIARQPNGSWSPPSGIHVTSIGAGFVAGLDIYDCVIVINTREALDLFTKTRLSLGSDLAVTAGPFGAGGALEWGVPPGEKKEDKKKEGLKPGAPAPPPPLSADNTKFQTKPVSEEDQLEEDDRPNRKPSPFREAIKKPVYSYVKSRGLFAGVQIDGTVVAEREGANARFYGQAVPVAKILKGEVPVQGPPGMWPAAAKGLFDVLKGAEGWRGPGQQGPGQQGPPPVSPGLVYPTASGAAGNAAGVGAPPTTWVPPPAPAPAPGLTTGMQNLGIRDGASAAGPSTIPPGPPPQPTAAASAKAAEAAAEAAHQQPPAQQAPPPSYSEFHHGAAEDLPPAYAEDDRSRLPTGDSKTGLH